MENTAYIYVLIDPRNNEIRYVGKTIQKLHRRLSRHLNHKNKSHKKSWIDGLKKEGLKPIIDILDVVPEQEWVFWEKYYISLFKTWGFDLLNHTNGGDGVERGTKPWNWGLKGVLKSNSGSFKKGERRSVKNEFKKGERRSVKTEFKKGELPHNTMKVGLYDLNNKLIEVFESQKDLYKNYNLKQQTVSKAIKRGSVVLKKYKIRKYDT